MLKLKRKELSITDGHNASKETNPNTPQTQYLSDTVARVIVASMKPKKNVPDWSVYQESGPTAEEVWFSGELSKIYFSANKSRQVNGTEEFVKVVEEVSSDIGDFNFHDKKNRSSTPADTTGITFIFEPDGKRVSSMKESLRGVESGEILLIANIFETEAGEVVRSDFRVIGFKRNCNHRTERGCSFKYILFQKN